MSSQFASPAVMAAATPISSTATSATCQPEGPIEASRPPPSGPPDTAASTPAAQPLIAPQARPPSGAASIVGLGAVRTVSSPPNAPATYGVASRASDVSPGAPGCGACGAAGSPASRGNSGSGPSTVPVGATTVPTPKANPGPTMEVS